MHHPSRSIRWHRHQSHLLDIEQRFSDWAVGLFFAVLAFVVITHA